MTGTVTPCMTLYGGRRVDPLSLRPEDISIKAIAHGLACTNRFGGHAREPISVAQHSVCVARLVPNVREMRRQALLHDASEAFIGDVVKWLKAMPEFAAYRVVEAKTQAMIFDCFGCPRELAPEVELADRTMVRFEGTRAYGDEWFVQHPELPEGETHPLYPRWSRDEERRLLGQLGGWHAWSWQEAERNFLGTFWLCGEMVQ